MPFKKIIIAIDSSAVSLNAAQTGLSLAKQLDAQVALVYIIDISKEVGYPDLGIIPDQSRILLLKQAEETLDQLIKSYGSNREVYHFTPEGLPKDEIVNFAKQWNADLIIMGTHGRKGLEHFFIGSIAEYVVRHSNVPVMVVPNK